MQCVLTFSNALMQFIQACNNSSVLKIKSLFNLFVSQSLSHCCKLWAILPLNVLLLINQSPSHCRAWWAVSKVLVREALPITLSITGSFCHVTVTLTHFGSLESTLTHSGSLGLIGSKGPCSAGYVRHSCVASVYQAMIPDNQIEELWMESLMTMSEFCLEREPLVVSEPLPKDCKPESRLWKAKQVVEFGNLLDI